MLAIHETCPPFEVLVGQPSDRAGPWRAALARAFELGRTLHHRVEAELRAGRLDMPAFLRSMLSPADQAVQEDFQCDYPMELHSPFEGAESVAGAVWMRRSLFGHERDDAVMKLRFDAGAYELPLHVHDHSDRVIVVLKGIGEFHYTDESPETFDGAGVTTIPVEPGTVLVFTRGLLHTFSAPDEPLYLLSYHAPFIPLEDSRQFSLPPCRWIPPSGRFDA